MQIVLLMLFSLFMACHNVDKKSDYERIPPPFALEKEDPIFFSDETVIPGGMLQLRIPAAPTSFLGYAQSSPSNEEITSQILLPLIERHPVDDTLRPSLAKSWSYSVDRKTLTFQLREDHYWSDGVPITSDDVIFTFENLILNPDSPSNYLEVFLHQGQNTKIQRIDEKSFRFILPRPLPAILYTLTYLPILPKHKIHTDQVSPKNLASLWSVNTPLTQIVSSGPFILVSYKVGIKAAFVRNPYYFRSDPQGVQLPYVNHLELMIIPDHSQMLALYLAGKLDYLEISAQQFFYLTSHIEFNKNYTLFQSIPAKSSPSVAHIAFNFDAKDPNKAALFKNQTFRIAMEHLLNRPLIIDQVYHQFAQVEGTFINTTNQRFYHAESDALRRTFMPELAVELLKSLGVNYSSLDRWASYPEDEKFSLNILVPMGTKTGQEGKIALIFAQQLNEVGIRTHIETLDQHSMSQRLRQGDFEIVIRSIANSPDPGVRVRVYWQPGQFLYYFHPSTYNKETYQPQPQNMLSWEKELVHLYENANIAQDEHIRRRYYNEIQNIYAKQLPVIFTVRQDNLYTSQKSIKNIYLNDAGLLVFSPWTVGKKTLPVSAIQQ
ncbi:MAG: ABC transporter substrate-binding protein [Spirochaetia bacterium]